MKVVDQADRRGHAARSCAPSARVSTGSDRAGERDPTAPRSGRRAAALIPGKRREDENSAACGPPFSFVLVMALCAEQTGGSRRRDVRHARVPRPHLRQHRRHHRRHAAGAAVEAGGQARREGRNHRQAGVLQSAGAR